MRDRKRLTRGGLVNVFYFICNKKKRGKRLHSRPPLVHPLPSSSPPQPFWWRRSRCRCHPLLFFIFFCFMWVNFAHQTAREDGKAYGTGYGGGDLLLNILVAVVGWGWWCWWRRPESKFLLVSPGQQALVYSPHALGGRAGSRAPKERGDDGITITTRINLDDCAFFLDESYSISRSVTSYSSVPNRRMDTCSGTAPSCLFCVTRRRSEFLISDMYNNIVQAENGKVDIKK